MKVQDIEKIRTELWKEGYELEIPYQRFAREVAKYTGIDKYKIKYAIQTLEDLGYIEIANRIVRFIDTEDELEIIAEEDEKTEEELREIEERLRKEAEEKMKRLEETKAV